GVLEILGRADDMINSGGVKISAPAVEQALRAHPDVRACAVIGLPDPEWGESVSALVVPADPDNPPAMAELQERVRVEAGPAAPADPDNPTALEQLQERVGAEAGRAAAPKTVRCATELPLRGPGKIDRHAVRTALQR